MLDLDSQFLCESALAEYMSEEEYQNRPKHILDTLTKIFCNNSLDDQPEEEITKLSKTPSPVEHPIEVNVI